MSTKAPKHLGKWGKALWEEFVEEYGLCEAGELQYLTVAAECLDRLRQAQELVDKHGVCVETAAGGLKSNPALIAEKDARSGMLKALAALNLDLEPLRDHPGRPGEGTGWTGRLNS